MLNVKVVSWSLGIFTAYNFLTRRWGGAAEHQ